MARWERLLKEAAEVSVALDQVEGTVQGIPHYSVVEARVSRGTDQVYIWLAKAGAKPRTPV